jgi:hypothetical protein
VMEAVTEPMSHEEVEAHVAAMLGEHPDEAFNQPGYHHPAGGCVWPGGRASGFLDWRQKDVGGRGGANV